MRNLENVKKDLAFSISKNSMSMSNLSAKENTNIESKSENESEMQDEPQKCENFTDFYSIYEKNILIKLLWLISI